MTNHYPKLKRLVEKLGCLDLEDDKAGTCIEIYCKDGWSFEEGERSCILVGYGSGGSYLPEWRQDAILEAIDRLNEEPADPIPYKY